MFEAASQERISDFELKLMDIDSEQWVAFPCHSEPSSVHLPQSCHMQSASTMHSSCTHCTSHLNTSVVRHQCAHCWLADILRYMQLPHRT